MTAADDAIAAQLFTFGFFLLIALYVLSLIKRGNRVRWSDLRGVPLVFIPLVSVVVQIKAGFHLRRSERIAAFVQLAHDLWMRKQRANGFIARRSRR